MAGQASYRTQHQRDERAGPACQLPHCPFRDSWADSRRVEGSCRARTGADASSRGERHRRRASDRFRSRSTQPQCRLGRALRLQYGGGRPARGGGIFGPCPRVFLCRRTCAARLTLAGQLGCGRQAHHQSLCRTASRPQDRARRGNAPVHDRRDHTRHRSGESSRLLGAVCRSRGRRRLTAHRTHTSSAMAVEGNMSTYQPGESSLVCGRTSSAGIFALMLLFHSHSAGASTSVSVLATLPEAAGAITQHLSGDALPVGAKYRIIVSPESANSLTVDALSESGRKDRLFGADKVTANRSIVLPEDGGWYPVPTASREFRLVVTNGGEVSEHIVRTLDSSPRTGKDSL